MLKKYLFTVLLIIFYSSFHLEAQTQMEMEQTAYNDYKKADTELNKIYKLVVKILNEKEQKLLILAQKDWRKFRDSQCKFEVEQYNGGSIQPLMYFTCLKEQTNNRIVGLKAILEDEER